MEAGDEQERDDAERLGGLFLALSRAAHGLSKSHVGELELTPAQSRALVVLDACTEAPSMTELAKRLRVVARAMTPVADALEEGGYVRREVDPGNRRATLLRLTEEGRAMSDRLRLVRRRSAGELFAPLSTEERATLLDLMEKVMASQPSWVTDTRAFGHRKQ